MSATGRLDVVKSLKQYFEVAGPLRSLDISESVLPVALMADLSRPPFSAALGWMSNGDAGAAVVGEQSWVGVRLNAGAPKGSRLTVERVFIDRGAVIDFWFDIFGATDIPGATIAAQAALDVTNVGETAAVERTAPHVDILGGNEPALAPNRGLRVPIGHTGNAFIAIELPPVTLVPGASLAIIAGQVQQAFSVGMWGYLHIGAGR